MLEETFPVNPVKPFLLLLFPLVTASISQAATIVYNFNGDTTQANSATTKTSAATSNDFGSGVTVSVLTLTPGDGGTSSITDTHGFTTGDMHGYVSFRVSNPTVSLTITVDSGHTLDLSGLSLTYGAYTNASGHNGSDTSYTLTSSLGGITSGSTGGVTLATNSLATSNDAATFGPALSGLTNTSVTFTWSMTTANNYDSANADRGHVIDNVVLTGTVAAVPEPSAFLLGAFGLLGVLRRRRVPGSR